MAARMSVELTESEKALLPYMTNDLYNRCYSIIATHFPIMQDVGRRLVNRGLLTGTEYLEICRSQEKLAGSHLISSLTRKGDDSMKTFYEVLVRARGERDVDVVLHSLEEAAADQKRRSKENGAKEDLGSISRLPSVPREDSVLASHDAHCTTQVDLKLVKHIWESVDREIHEIRKDMLEVKETLKQLAMAHQVEVQMEMEQQQQPGAVSNCNVEEQPHAPVQRPRVSELDSCESVYHTCPNSGENGKGDQKVGEPVIREGCPTQPLTTLNLQPDLKQQPVEKPTSPITRDSALNKVSDKISMDVEPSTQPSTEGEAATGETSNLAEPDPLPVDQEETTNTPNVTPPGTTRQSRHNTDEEVVVADTSSLVEPDSLPMAQEETTISQDRTPPGTMTDRGSSSSIKDTLRRMFCWQRRHNTHGGAETDTSNPVELNSLPVAQEKNRISQDRIPSGTMTDRGSSSSIMDALRRMLCCTSTSGL